MMYEIPREIFKQKLLDRSNICMIQVVSNKQQEIPYKDIKTLEWSSQMPSDFSNSYPNKGMSYVFYGFDNNAVDAKKAAEALSAMGYPFVYFYQGSLEQDKVLDKGIN